MMEKKVIVTGASSGIGRATVERFLDEGHNVALVGRREKELNEISSAHRLRARLSQFQPTLQMKTRPKNALRSLSKPWAGSTYW
jgi:NADP-dependent 3-hydroxy acid dehydrogenase YdfG